MKKHFEIILTGKVKDKGIKLLIMIEAERNQLYGIAQYQKDHSLLLKVGGSNSSLTNFIDWLKQTLIQEQGFTMELFEGKFKNYKEFLIAENIH